ncbi:MAG TPA: glycosyltransferase [Bacteroidales bacterium]|nr:glycosyltransferase [Bacteroidales bacterium]
MISILIPVYNYDVTLLVNTLSHAIDSSELFCEIIIGSDGCSKDYVSIYIALTKLEKVDLYRSEVNIGRAAIRNRLIEKASGEWLLFIDADALIEGNASDYLGKWHDYISSPTVICGGTAYPPLAPEDPDKYLRWHYGFLHEQKSTKERNKEPYASFSGFNFLIEKNLFSRIKFNEELRNYGHEDTLLGYQLKKAGVNILHIDNALIHDGVESNREFLEKTQEGIQNLSILYDKVTDRKTFASTVKILKIYRRLRFIGADRIITRIFIKKRRRMEIILRRKKCSLKIFLFYKLGLFSYIRLESR